MQPRCVPSLSRYDTKEEERKKQEVEKASRLTARRTGMAASLLLQGHQATAQTQNIGYYMPSNRSLTNATAFSGDLYTTRPRAGK